MEKYVYLLLGLSLGVITVVLLILRRDLLKKALLFGFAGGVVGLFAEVFYFRDYWRPPSIMGVAQISFEDFLFGFTIAALSVILYPVLTRTFFRRSDIPSRKKLYGLFFVFGLASMLIFNIGLGFNSIFVSSAVFLLLSAVMLFMRQDLIRIALLSSLIAMTIIVLIYVILFNFLAPDYWDKYWLLSGTKWGITLLGNVPLTELIWYFSWVMFASISYSFASGKVLTKLKVVQG